MDFSEKAKIRLGSWIHHNEHHLEEYEEFLEQLSGAGQEESARYVREMIELTSRSTLCLRKALEALDKK
jgi:hypothetical protein